MSNKFKYLISSIIFFCGLLLPGCDDKDEPEVNYYVRYTAIAEPNTMVNMNFLTADGNKLIQTSMPDGKFQYTVGPVHKGFRADLVVSYHNEKGGSVDFLTIEVAIGSEPFVLVKSGKNYISLEYEIE